MTSALDWDGLQRFLAGPDWTVIHIDGRSEPFDGQRLVESMVRAGVPIFEAISFYREFLERAGSRVRDDEIRLSDVTSLVTNLLMQSTAPGRAAWVRNYDNLFGFEQEFPGAPLNEASFIDPSDGGRLERVLRDLLREQLGVAPDLPGAVPREAVDEAVGRMVAIVRLCEFHRIPRAFLETMVKTLAAHSSDVLLPGVEMSEDQGERPLQLAEDLVGAATLHANSPAYQEGVSTLLILATSPAASYFLQYYGFMPRARPGAVLQQMHRALEVGAGQSAKAGGSVQPTAAVVAYQRLSEELGRYGLRPKQLLDTTMDLIGSLGLETDAIAADEVSGRVELGSGALDLARQFIGLIRIATNSSPKLRAVMDTMGARPLDPDAVVVTLLSALRSLGLSAASHEVAGRGVVTTQMNVRSRIGEYAQEVAIMVSDAALDGLAVDISELVTFVAGPPVRAGFLASTALDPAEGRPSPKLNKEQFEHLTELATEGVLVVPIGTRRLLGALASGALFLDTLAGALEGTYPTLRPT